MRNVRIGDLGRVITGRTPPTGDSGYFGAAYPFITPSDMHQGKYARETARLVSSEGAEHLRRLALPANSVCVSCIGWQMGEVVMTDRPSFTNQQINAIVPHPEVNASFLYYSLRPRKQELLSLAAAAGVRTPILNKSLFCNLEVRLPPIAAQRRIAGVLSAYDDLIETSERRIKILERIACALYREWFVSFRFPGHDELKFVASKLGDVPEGWDVKPLGDACHLTMGQSPKSEFYNQAGNGLPFHQGVSDFGQRFPADRLFCTVDGRRAERGDILFSVRAPVGRMNIAERTIIIGRGVSALRSKTGHQEFLWEQLRARFTEEDMIGNGAIFAAVTKADMQRIDLICPPRSILDLATKHLGPIHREIAVLSNQIANLRRTRDLLLTRLMSGQLTLPD